MAPFVFGMMVLMVVGGIFVRDLRGITAYFLGFVGITALIGGFAIGTSWVLAGLVLLGLAVFAGHHTD